MRCRRVWAGVIVVSEDVQQRETHLNTTTMLLCSFCSGTRSLATAACENCTYYYCSGCLDKYHPSVGPLKSHNIIKASAQHCEEAFCQSHNEKYCIFCENCAKLLCLKCVVHHASHDLSNTDEAYKHAKGTLSKKQDDLDTHLKAATKLKKDHEEQIKLLKMDAIEAVKKVQVECEFLRSSVSAREKTMIQTIQKDALEKTKDIQKALKEIPKVSSDSMKIMNRLSGIQNHTSINLFLAQFGELSACTDKHLALLNSLAPPQQYALNFNYKSFNCSKEVSMLGDKLCISTDNPHDFPFIAGQRDSDGDTSSLCSSQSGLASEHSTTFSCDELQEMVYQADVHDSRPSLAKANRLSEYSSRTIPSSKKDTNIVEPSNSERNVPISFAAKPRPPPYPQTFLNRVLSKHPEFLPHSLSLDAVLRRQQEHDLEEKEPWFEPKKPSNIMQLFGNQYVLGSNNNNMNSPVRQGIFQSCKRNQLESVLLKFKEECGDIGDLLRLDKSDSTNHKLSAMSKAIPTTTQGVTQRSKHSYYSGYRLTSERKEDEHVQELLFQQTYVAEENSEGKIDKPCNSDMID
ncbi:uncharacterized protein [Watersipora subatra]|uniref:uncharacterized protein n=1 Tax=Watersipora subatra TaxID=2589382 RepID=UPI00355BB751